MKRLLLMLSKSESLRKRVRNSKLAWKVAGRFVGGVNRSGAIEAARRLQAGGMQTTLDYLGESVETLPEAAEAKKEYIDLLSELHAAGVSSHASLKPSQLGLALDKKACRDNVAEILRKAKEVSAFLRIDMEDSSLTSATLDLFSDLAREFDNVGIVIQSYLYRSESDVRDLLRHKARSIRLCKGAYLEPRTVAFARKRDVDGNYVNLMGIILDASARNGTFWPALATHDEKMIRAASEAAKGMGLSPDRFEFQMLYGIRRDLQAKLVEQGYRVRVYVPYGSHWYPYLMRRMAERPANILFVLKNFFR